jgi:hypothetical protein
MTFAISGRDGKRSLGELPVCGRGAAVSMLIGNGHGDRSQYR